MYINRINTKILPVEFKYFAPKTVSEAASILNRYGEEVRILAGGTDLLVKVKQRLIEPKYILNVKGIEELRFIEDRSGEIGVGAATKLSELVGSEIIKEKLPVLHEAAEAVGSVQIRNMGTIGGNLCNASPASDLAPPLLVLNTSVKAYSSSGERVISLEKFFLGPGETVLKPNELLVEIKIPCPPEGTGMSFLKVARTSMDLAKANVAVAIKLKGNTVEQCRIAMGSVAPTPIRLFQTEKILLGSEFTDGKIERAVQTASEEIKPITDIRSTAEYRREVSKVLVRRALKKAYERVKEGEING